MGRALKAIIDCNALQWNLRKVRETAPNSKILAMVKANGYGHGIVNVAKALKTANAFGVACIEEACELRRLGIAARIILMEGFFNGKEELQEIVHLNLEPIIHHAGQVKALQQGEGLKSLSVWIKINTGMHRLGFPIEEATSVWETLSTIPFIKIEGFLTHFSKADEINDPYTQLQMDRFFQVVKKLPGAKSLANSAAILRWHTSHADWVRPGIMLYGVSPFRDRCGLEEGLQPVMTLRSELIAVQSLKKGEAVGYGGVYVCPTDTRIGIVAAGYGDGYPLLAPAGTPVLLNGKRVPLIGRVAMDMITVDLSTQPEARVGDPVQLWGRDLPVEAVASVIGTTAYALLTGLSIRVPFEILP
jgi:alanine racemase